MFSPPEELALALLPRYAHAAAPPPPPPVAVTLPSHHRPTIGIDLPQAQDGQATATGTPTAGVAVSITPTPTTTVTGIATATATATMQGPLDGPSEPPPPGECRLLGPFAILVQLALGALALLSLVYKRWRERPQRPVKIWFFDASKQVFGSALVHVANVFMSMLTSGRFSIKVDPAMVATGAGHGATAARAIAEVLVGRQPGSSDYVPNPCSFYLLNLAIDTTLGIPILIVFLRVFTRLVAYTPWGKPLESIQSGNYGHPPNAWWWLKQSLIYFCGLMGMKICVLVLFMMLPWLSRVGDWALGWTEGNEKLQIVFVMMLFPLIMNALQYYIIDSFIKKKDSDEGEDDGRGHHHVIHGGSGPHHQSGRNGGDIGSYEELSVSEGSGDEEDEEEEGQQKRGTGSVHLPRRSSREYDPAVDGDSHGALGSGSKDVGDRGKTLPKELYPPE